MNMALSKEESDNQSSQLRVSPWATSSLYQLLAKQMVFLFAPTTIYMLYNLVQLALTYCRKLNVVLCAEKTKLLLYADKTFSVPLNPIMINNEAIKFSDEAEHVGVVRSTKGNLPNILNRIQAYKQSNHSILSQGLARGHRSNPAACIRVLRPKLKKK